LPSTPRARPHEERRQLLFNQQEAGLRNRFH
jgi:hypothetical protein